MRYSEIINERILSMGELDELIISIQSLNTVTCSIDKDDQKKKQVWIIFELYGSKGYLVLEAKDHKNYINLLRGAATSELGGNIPTNITTTINELRGTIRSNAIKILTNPENWKVVQYKYDEPIQYPEDKKIFNSCI